MGSFVSFHRRIEPEWTVTKQKRLGFLPGVGRQYSQVPSAGFLGQSGWGWDQSRGSQVSNQVPEAEGRLLGACEAF